MHRQHRPEPSTQTLARPARRDVRRMQVSLCDELQLTGALQLDMPAFDCKSSACTACLSAATPRLRSERHSERHRNQEFIEFLEQIEASAPAGQDIRAVLDNYAAHKHGAVNEWLGKHDRWGFHSTPTSCSWLKVVEGFLGKPARRRLRRGVHDSIEQLEKTILDFIELHNGKEAKPFRWTSSPERLIAARQRGTQVLRTNH